MLKLHIFVEPKYIIFGSSSFCESSIIIRILYINIFLIGILYINIKISPILGINFLLTLINNIHNYLDFFSTFFSLLYILFSLQSYIPIHPLLSLGISSF